MTTTSLQPTTNRRRPGAVSQRNGSAVERRGALRRQPEVTERGFVLLGQWVRIKKGRNARRQAQVLTATGPAGLLQVRPLGEPEWARVSYFSHDLEPLHEGFGGSRQMLLAKRLGVLLAHRSFAATPALAARIERRIQRVSREMNRNNSLAITLYTGGAR